MHPTPQGIAAELRAEMARQRVTLTKLSQATDTPASTLHRRLNHPERVTLEHLSEVCKALGVSLAEIVARAQSASAA